MFKKRKEAQGNNEEQPMPDKEDKEDKRDRKDDRKDDKRDFKLDKIYALAEKAKAIAAKREGLAKVLKWLVIVMVAGYALLKSGALGGMKDSGIFQFFTGGGS
jgi:hypothetical protein|tara:strand:- start:10189 stop:10497 length:309 start_codon:yes stop_codon:yes gene_type:complete